MMNTDIKHKHTYDEQGKITCCSLEDKVNLEAEQKLKRKELSSSILTDGIKEYLPSIVSFVLLLAAIIIDNFIEQKWFTGYLRIVWYVISYLPVGIPVIMDAGKAMLKRDIFSEFFLMSIATIGAFAIGEYPEGVAVMLFYAVGELFQSAAVKRAKGSIKALLDIRPDSATVIRNGKTEIINPETVQIGETIQVRSGEKIPLDGFLISEKGSFNTAALTGESKPDTKYKNETVLAGMINIGQVIEIKVTKLFSDSSISRILDLVQNATTRKAQTELFIRKFARIYTPIVVVLATMLTMIPYFFMKEYVFSEWLYRSLIFLVISCPCALVISIPLGYFGGIGAASRNGILFKGSNYLDLMTKVNTVVMDKTGTLTKGIFKVQKVKSETLEEDDFISLVAAIEANSTHPIAKAIVAEADGKYKNISITSVEEISGHGLKGIFNSETILAGNTKLLQRFNIKYPSEVDLIIDTIVVVALGNQYIGYITISDEIKEDAVKAIQDLKSMSIQAIMLSGDKQAVVDQVAKELKIEISYGDLLPQDKVAKVEELRKDKSLVIAFVGDGINDAPVLALSDVGIAMGGLGSDAAIETADVIIQTDHPSKIATAIAIGKATKKIVWQNIAMAFLVKAIVLSLGAGGLATMWEAVFADVGVALLAILNAIRIQRVRFV
ncbi:MAG: cadmium-translocating P-type ATPase [Sphingobacteriaceae bacterium]|nr:cadmium-translocating P-type ATPase [Sphingobacteriaceae bacterium]